MISSLNEHELAARKINMFCIQLRFTKHFVYDLQPLFLWLISKDSLTTQTTSIQPCSLPILSPKKACHFWTSSLASQTTESQLLSSTNLQMPTASSTMNHHIRRNAKTPSPTPSSAVSAVFVLMMRISIQKQRKCLPSLNKTTIQNTSLKEH